MGTLWERVLDTVLPRRCVFCGAVQHSDLPCPTCQRELPWLTGREAESRVEFTSLCASALRYQEPVRGAVLRLKFARRRGYLRTLGPITAQCARDHLKGPFDLVTWTPLSRRSLRARGFDQARLLAEYVAGAYGMEATALLKKRAGVGRQSAIRDEAQRRANALGAFSLLEGVEVWDRRVLLVDDVVTTGATLGECARVLRTAGCREVAAVTLARAGRPAPPRPKSRW